MSHSRATVLKDKCKLSAGSFRRMLRRSCESKSRVLLNYSSPFINVDGRRLFSYKRRFADTFKTNGCESDSLANLESSNLCTLIL
jgi:hypothetical protein